MTISIHFKYRPRGEGDWLFMKSSYEYYGVSRPTHVGAQDRFTALPDTWAIVPENPRLANGKTKPTFVVMTDDFCHWLFRLNVEHWQRRKFASEEEYMSFWKSLTRDHQLIKWWRSLMKGDRSNTNEFGSETNREPIGQTNMDKEPMRLFQLIHGRILLKRVKDRITKYGVSTINASQGYRQWYPDKNPELFYQPLLSERRRIGTDARGNPIWDEKLLQPYSQFEPAHPIFPIILPYDSIGWIGADHIRVLSPKEPTPPQYFMR